MTRGDGNLSLIRERANVLWDMLRTLDDGYSQIHLAATFAENIALHARIAEKKYANLTGRPA